MIRLLELWLLRKLAIRALISVIPRPAGYSPHAPGQNHHVHSQESPFRIRIPVDPDSPIPEFEIGESGA